MKKILLLVPVLAALIVGCTYTKQSEITPAGACVTTSSTFSKVVQPIITQNCALSGCHDASTASDGYDFSAYAGVKKGADNGQLIGTITHSSGFQAMPQGALRLPDCDISQIQAWVTDGALNN